VLKTLRGNLLESDVEALVNTVNTVGIMGKGIALQFKRTFPDNFAAYERACKTGTLQPGRVFTFATDTLHNPRYIINFPTKRHWKGRSRIEDIQTGLSALVQEIERMGIRSIALPPLGCGNGGLEWSQVFPLIRNVFDRLPDVEVLVFEPVGAPAASKMINRTARPLMTPGRAVVLGLIQRYRATDYHYRLSLLEVQKLAYFMQCAGQRLNLDFIAATYGPYADKLRHVLSRMEGHFIEGYGDGNNKPTTRISPLPAALSQSEAMLLQHLDVKARFDRVSDLIEGFETPYGMELISSVHWIVMQIDQSARTDPEAVVAGVHAWSPRKRKLFKAGHIRIALSRLSEQGWLESSTSPCPPV
jgi:O-acetyl-ADP-ribose deacetylase (regulator of RNase III)